MTLQATTLAIYALRAVIPLTLHSVANISLNSEFLHVEARAIAFIRRFGNAVCPEKERKSRESQVNPNINCILHSEIAINLFNLLQIILAQIHLAAFTQTCPVNTGIGTVQGRKQSLLKRPLLQIV